MRDLQFGMLGVDTSHGPAFASLLNGSNGRGEIQGAKMVTAFPEPSALSISMDRVGQFTEEVRSYGVKVTKTIEEMVEGVDAVLILSADGACHLDQLKRLVPWGKPVFIDKPFALTGVDAEEMKELARSLPVMSSSALRFAEGLTVALGKGAVCGASVFGPVDFLKERPGFSWYGIHMVEMLFRALGTGVRSVRAECDGKDYMLKGIWKDGRIGKMRGIGEGDASFGGTIHYKDHSERFAIRSHHTPFYTSLLEAIIRFVHEGRAEPPLDETVAIIRFLEALDVSLKEDRVVML